jgi:nicotinamidase-related amidase
MHDALVVLDVFNDFEHDDGRRLLASFRERMPALRALLDGARAADAAVVYVNDRHGSWSGDRKELLERAGRGKGGELTELLAPLPDEPVLLKSRYSAFDHTDLELLLHEIGAERLLLAGASTEGCVVQTGIDARELRFKVTILTAACATVDPGREQVALRYAEEVAGIHLARDLAALDPPLHSLHAANVASFASDPGAERSVHGRADRARDRGAGPQDSLG